MLTTKVQELSFLHGRMVSNEWHRRKVGTMTYPGQHFLNAAEKMVIKDELTI